MPSSYLFLNGLRLHYLHWSLGSPQRPVVLLHGLASNARIWEMVGPALAASELPALAPDQRGHGLTDAPDGDYGFETFSRDLAAFLEACNLEKPLLVGHSWGAMVALDYATRFAFGPRAPAGLVLVDGGVTQLDDAPGATWEQARDRLTPPRLDGMPLEDFQAMLKSSDSSWQPGEQELSIIMANFAISEDEKITPHLSFEHHMQIVRAMWEFQTYAAFSRLRCPILLVPAQPAEPRSAREQAFLEQKQRGVARILQITPAVQVRWVVDSIHDIPLQRPAELAQLILEFGASLR